MLKIEFTAQFKRDYKLAKKRGCNPKKLAEVMKLLQNQISLPEKYKDHERILGIFKMLESVTLNPTGF